MKDVLNSKSIKVCSMRFQEKFLKCIINCYDRRLSATKIRCKHAISSMESHGHLVFTFDYLQN